MVPVVKACTMDPVVGSTSAAASRTCLPVMRWMSCRSDSEELAKSWR
jgi:hypothetical protein